MAGEKIYLKELPLHKGNDDIKGGFIQRDGEEFYQIKNYDQMRPFFMSLVSHSDHWMFISTTGGLTAGRESEESALFPYYTDDKVRDDYEVTGSKSIFKVHTNGKGMLWEPFSDKYQGGYAIKRNLYKNLAGNKLIFEEINADLELSFQYSWSFSELFGFVKSSKLSNLGAKEVYIEILDGIQNILPYGVLSSLQSTGSNLVNAYKKNELDPASGLGMFMLSAIIVDKAEPSEALKTTTVWSAGIQKEKILLSSLQLNKFRQGLDIDNEVDIRAERGAYFINSKISIAENSSHEWKIVAEVNQDHGQVVELINQLDDEEQLLGKLAENISIGSDKLMNLVAKADGLQKTNDKLIVGRHYSNVLFNIMRGGIFDEDYLVKKEDFLDYVKTINKDVYKEYQGFFQELAEKFDYMALIEKARFEENKDLIRICYEYLPLTFSRRHGDPSRPWNKFKIAIKDDQGRKLRKYEGNWRDIFQNWEALALSFPNYILSMISKFVNASTIDGYNPYRITREGIDWEVIEEDNPWSYIGYWGDHQIIYLEKLLEIAISHQPDQLNEMLDSKQFVYANVPYRIKPLKDIIEDPQDTIEYDYGVESDVEKIVAEKGADGKMVHKEGKMLKASLMEKLLVSFLAKMSNYIPEGGIWLNTQRPEWNDANNALVGNGVSMVTLYYMRRMAVLLKDMLSDRNTNYRIHEEVYSLFEGVKGVLEENLGELNGSLGDDVRRSMIMDLGTAGEAYRNQAYNGFSENEKSIDSGQIATFFDVVLKHIDHSISVNRRSDGLYHAYNLLSLDDSSASIDHLYEMLEGQVAVLSSGFLNLKESLEVLDALKASDIYREDQYSYMLYPNRTLPRFLEKNNIPSAFIESSKLAAKLKEDNHRTFIYEDVNGVYHFNGAFNNAESLKDRMEALKEEGYQTLVDEEYKAYLRVFEEMFNHKSFTGRSGTFYGYEGLGSIYWHMVSKLLVAVQENIVDGWSEYQGREELGKMIDHYYDIRAGIGINKSPKLYGSIPTDPYSHTPGGRGVQQPGMTGQVKEDILNRWAELGVKVEQAAIRFDPLFMDGNEYLTEEDQFHYFNIEGDRKSITLTKNQLAFTYCQVPIIYEKSDQAGIEVRYLDGNVENLSDNLLTPEISKELFNRTKSIENIKVLHNQN